MSYSKNFPLRLRQARKAKKINQADIARLIGVHARTYGNWERGQQGPDVVALGKICDILKVTPSWLFNIEENYVTNSSVVQKNSEFKTQSNQSNIDTELLEIIIKSLQKAMAETKVNIPADKQAKLITYAYEQLSRDWDELKAEETIDKLFQMVI